jgi:EAL domain-containing protein (putative c-di-GMP-specific phosphodiesterase class I)
VKCSIGIARITESQSAMNVVLENADKACIQAQKNGGNQYAHFQLVAQRVLDSSPDTEWQNIFKQALVQNNFSLQFQPIVNLHGEEQEFYEVLLRLKKDDGSLIKAEDFIDHAVQSGMMAEIDKWVIRTSLDRLADHRQQFPKTRFFLKLSEQSLDVAEFVEWLDASLQAHSLPGNAVIFEISETAALANVNSIKGVINKLKQIGCEFGLEHFGSGIDFSNSLTMLDVDFLKINGTFVENMSHDPENQAAVKAIIEMTKEAGKKSIAEFVSDANSLALLWRLGVDYAQGYYIHEPSDEMDYDFEEEDDL